MRFYSFFFEQFLHALLKTDPYNDPKLQFEMVKSRKTIKKDGLLRINDFKQDTEIIDMNVLVQDISVTLPDRPKSKKYLVLHIEKLSCHQVLEKKSKRLNFKQDKKLYVV